MIPLFSNEGFIEAKATDLLPMKCELCLVTFHQTKTEVIQHKTGNPRRIIKFCSKQCRIDSSKTSREFKCEECDKTFTRTKSQVKDAKHLFCSQSCAAKFNNRNKTSGFRKSKLEIALELVLPQIYPTLQFKFSDRKIIGLELDLFIPELKIAFEFNGVVHYMDIYGKETFNKIVQNDKVKIQRCAKLGIDLRIFDVSNYPYITQEIFHQHLKNIVYILNIALNSNTEILKYNIDFNDLQVTPRTMSCNLCGNIYASQGRKYCSKKCYKEIRNQSKIKMPPKHDLEQDLKWYSYRELGKKYSVSYGLVYKWAKTYDLTK